MAMPGGTRGWHTSWQPWCRPAGVGVVCAPRGWEQGSGILHPRLWFDCRVERGQTGPVLVCWAPCLHSVSCFLTLRPGSTAWPGWLHPLTHPPTIPLSIPLSIPGSSRCRQPCLTGSSSSRCWPHPTAGSGRGFAGQRWPRRRGHSCRLWQHLKWETEGREQPGPCQGAERDAVAELTNLEGK